MSFEPIPAFNNKLDFKDAFGWNKETILGFLEKVAAKPGDYGASPDRQQDFKLLYGCIFDLRPPDGARYVQPKRPQQILRTGPKPPKLDPTHPIPWEVNDKEKPYFIIFDLLGAFLSIMGHAPDGATAKNYFLPLVVIYAKWCSVLAKSISATPSVAQITWAREGAGKSWYSFLGVSASGYDGGNPWEPLVKKERHSYLLDILPTKYHDYTKSPAVEADAQTGTLFGNCAETYPFTYILADPKLRQNASGIALCVGGTDNRSKYDGSDYWKKDGSLWAPCENNCQSLMKWYGAFDRLPEFTLWEHDPALLSETEGEIQ